MPCNKLLITVAFPIIVSMLVQAMYNIVDSIFVARISDEALNAVSLAFPLQNLIIAIAVGTGVGTNAVLSKALGARQFDRVNRVSGNSLVLALLSGVAIMLFGLFGSRAYFTMQTDMTQVIDMGEEYVFIVCVFSFGVFMQVAVERLLQSTGKTLLSMAMQLTGAVTNIVLDPILIFGYCGMPKMGVAGAAIATVIGQFLAMTVGLGLHFGLNKEIRIKLKDLIPSGAIIKQIYMIGVPAILMSSLASVMVLGLNRILLGFNTEEQLIGMTATNVLGIYFKLQSFVFMPTFGLTNGMVPIVAYNYGARNRDRIVKTIRLSMIYAVAIMLIGLVVVQAIPGPLLRMFSASEEMMDVGITALRIISISFVVAGFNIVCSSTYQALGNSVYSLLISIARQLVIILPVAWLLSLTGRLEAVWWAIPVAEALCVGLCLVFLRLILRRISPERMGHPAAQMLSERQAPDAGDDPTDALAETDDTPTQGGEEPPQNSMGEVCAPD